MTKIGFCIHSPAPQQLAVLRSKNIVEMRRVGVNGFYRVRAPAWFNLLDAAAPLSTITRATAIRNCRSLNKRDAAPPRWPRARD
ncbi:MAG: hypothetical protein K1X65_20285 [Caldilineales bacterium]|nr:hypothetical protein [Caldilineales bacterium]